MLEMQEDEGGGGKPALQGKGPGTCTPLGTSELGVFCQRTHNGQAASSGMNQMTAAPLLPRNVQIKRTETAEMSCRELQSMACPWKVCG